MTNFALGIPFWRECWEVQTQLKLACSTLLNPLYRVKSCNQSLLQWFPHHCQSQVYNPWHPVLKPVRTIKLKNKDHRTIALVCRLPLIYCSTSIGILSQDCYSDPENSKNEGSFLQSDILPDSAIQPQLPPGHRWRITSPISGTSLAHPRPADEGQQSMNKFLMHDSEDTALMSLSCELHKHMGKLILWILFTDYTSTCTIVEDGRLLSSRTQFSPAASLPLSIKIALPTCPFVALNAALALS